MKKKKNRLLGLLLSLVMVLGMMPEISMKAKADVPQSGGNAYVGYRKTDNGFDVYGKSGNRTISTTFRDGGYTTVMQVGNSVSINFDNFAYGKEYTSEGVKSSIEARVRGKAVLVTYTLVNTSGEAKTVKIGSWADTQIGDDDEAPCSFTDSGIRMTSKDGSLEFQLIPGNGNFTTRWYGNYGGADDNVFVNRTDTATFTEDSGIAWSWTVEIPAGATVTRSAELSAGQAGTSQIIYDANGGTGEMDPTVDIPGESVTLNRNEYTKDNFTFRGWDTDSAGVTAVYADGATLNMPDTDTTLYAVWEENDNSGTLIVEPADGAPACEAGGLSSDDIVEIAAEEGFAGAGADDLALKLEVSNIDETVPAEEKAVAEDYAASLGENIHIGLYTDLSLFLVGGGNILKVTDLGGRSLTVYMIAPDYLLAPAGFTRHFIVFQIHNGVPIEVGRSSTRRIPVTAGRFSTYVIAYYDVADGGSGSHEHDHHICEKGHKFAYCVMQAPTTEVDGFAEWRCTQCGIYDWNDHDNADARETVTLSAYPVFNDTLENNIKAAEAGATVSIETKRWVSVRRGVLEALAEKPGVTLSIGFAKDGTDYVLTIPGGDPALAGILASEDRFFSFTTLGNTYGLTAVEK